MVHHSMSERIIKVKRVKNARHLRLRLGRGGVIVVSAPARASQKEIQQFVASQEGWIRGQEQLVRARDSLMMMEHDSKSRARLTADARDLIHWRLEHFNRHYGFAYNRVAIRNQSTRWGSCSSNRNLNFNYRITLLTPELQDYLIVHELCHLAEMNHGPRFWSLVGETIPDYKKLSKQLRADHDVASE
jgi:predicted metal-dependent hydrolase